jgi:hypothetical protein
MNAATGGNGGAADVIRAASELLSALVWPTIVAIVLFRFRKEVGACLAGLAKRLPEAQNVEFGPVKIAMQTAESVAKRVPADPRPQDQQEAIKEQTHIGKVLQAQVAQNPAMLSEVRRQMDDLARQYELLRAARDKQSRTATAEEIVQMNKVVSQMRALAIPCLPYWEDYAKSDRPGDRLVAVVMVQMSPDPKHLPWLLERFKVDRPFIFYHAALALQNMADQCWDVSGEQIKATAKAALEQVKSFAGEADAKTVQILQAIVNRQ